ncbi:MAG: glutamate mutase L, partial [Acidaminococcaceae bacterium]|nr:glutamate mutase L [Acidaminococcaceae bacterium]
MLLGIDVGGTFTDGVLIDKGQVLAQAKTATTHEDVLQGILAALDLVIGDSAKEIRRVVLSSTIVTNALTEHRLAPVFLATIP